MKLKLVLMLIVCVILAGCAKPPKPSAEKMRDALDKAVKAKNPNAVYIINGTTVDKSTGKSITVALSFDDFYFTGASGKDREFSKAKGTATFDYKSEGKWYLVSISVNEPEKDIYNANIPLD